jgi:DNA repair protein RadC
MAIPLRHPAGDSRRPGANGALPCEGPRERLRDLGAEALSVSELVTVVIGAGGRGASAADIAHELLGSVDGRLRGLARLSLDGLASRPGVGPATAARLLAALELGRRAVVEPGVSRPRIRGPEDVYRRLGPRLRDRLQEEFRTLLLDAQHGILRDVLVTRGILDASLIHPREVFRPAIEAGAAALILVHNHPSGDPTPSAEDRAVTRQLSSAGRTLGVPVLDHVVIGDGCWRSVSGEG